MPDRNVYEDGILRKFRDTSVFERMPPGSVYAPETISVPELEEKIREGEGWVLSHVWAVLAAAATEYICLATGSRNLHVRALGASDELTQLSVAENSIWTGGVPITPYCLNREREVSHDLREAIITPAALVDAGTTMWNGITEWVDWAALGGDLSENPTWMLAQYTNYHFSITNLSQANAVAALTLVLLIY